MLNLADRASISVTDFLQDDQILGPDGDLIARVRPLGQAADKGLHLVIFGGLVDGLVGGRRQGQPLEIPLLHGSINSSWRVWDVSMGAGKGVLEDREGEKIRAWGK